MEIENWWLSSAFGAGAEACSKHRPPIEKDGRTYIFLVSTRKAWHHSHHKHGWRCEADERYDFVDIGIYSKPISELTSEDQEEIECFGRPPEDWPIGGLRLIQKLDLEMRQSATYR